ncbi:MAG: ribonuclease HII [Treponema sp.]|nr:ribonuclease HII [Treponema sp.]
MLCGLDEAGRGPLAGPVCAAAVVLGGGFPLDLLDDSKKLKPRQRDAARRVIVEKALAWGVGWAGHAEIDRINILQASLLAMRRAFDCLFSPPQGAAPWPDRLEAEAPFGRGAWADVSAAVSAGVAAVADGTFAPELPLPCTALIKADASVPEVMAASILAKTARDLLMEHYGRLYPAYGYERHKGYPTKEHRRLVMEHGPSPIQRLTFRSIAF